MSSSLAPECSEKKGRYDTCFIKWYSEKYLRGEGSTDECEELFKEYKSCLNAALKQKVTNDLRDRGFRTGFCCDMEGVKGTYIISWCCDTGNYVSSSLLLFYVLCLVRPDRGIHKLDGPGPMYLLVISNPPTS
ncbi:hypothetical protein HOY80DRAFT_566645 [Tuber brumale]|nr:hypothetical protein HOY80DRAFT_566645 [Tuber brumale]